MLRLELAPLVGHRARRAIELLPWAPVLLGAAFLVLFAARFPRLIERVYWDSDAATAAVIAQTVGHGTVVLERYGWFTALWFALLTRPLPFHRQLWEIAPYLFSLLSVTLLAWTSWRLAGRFAAAMTAIAAVATSPLVSYDLVTLNFHTGTWTPTVVLAVLCLWLTGRPPVTRVAPALWLATLLAGTTLASDPLFAFVGLIPFALTGVVLACLPRLRLLGASVVASAFVALLIAWATNWVMSQVHVKVFPVPKKFAADTDIWPNFGRLIKQTIQLVNGDYFFDSPLSARSLLSFACAVLMLLALSAPFALVRRELRSGRESVPLLVYASFWAACVLFDCASFVLSSEGTHGGYYLIPILYATAATVPLLLSGDELRRRVVAFGVAVIATASIVNLADTKTSLFGGLPAVESVTGRIVDIANQEGAQYGYADYWDASSLTWASHMAVRVQPVSQCVENALCAYTFNLVSSWFDGNSLKSFVLRDTKSIAMRFEPPQSLGPPSATYKLNDIFTMYVYPYDVATRLDYGYASWHKSG